MNPVLVRILIFGLICLTGCFVNANAQESTEVDSLLQLLAKAEEDTSKVRLYFKLYNYSSFNDPEKSREYIDAALELAQKLDDRRGIVLCFDKLGGIAMYSSQFRKALSYYNIADSLLRDMDWPREQAVIYGNYAGIYKDIGMYDSAIHWNSKFIEIASELQNPVFEGYGLGITGDIYQVKGQFNIAARYHMQSLRIFESINNESRTGDALLKLGQAQLSGNNFEDAEKNLKRAAEIYLKINDLYFLRETYDNIGYVFYNQEKYTESEEWFQKASEIGEKVEDIYGIAQSVEGLEKIAYAQGQYELALANNIKARELYTQAEDRYNFAWRQADLANIYLQLDQYNTALIENQRAEELFKMLELPSGLRKTYQNAYFIYQALGKPAEALTAYENYTTIKDSLNNTQTATQLEELQLIYDVEKKDQEILLLSKDVELSRLKRQRLSWGLILTGLIAALVIYIQFIRRRRDQKIQEERNKLQAMELEKNKLEKEQLERDLAAQVLQLCRKNELLTTVQQEVAVLSKKVVPENQSNFRRLERTIQSDIQSDVEWDQFLSTFQKVHPDFLDQLRQRVKKLSPAEHRLACLLRMNLSSKDIATMLHISDEGVKKARYRLRKKLGLESQFNLQEYLINL